MRGSRQPGDLSWTSAGDFRAEPAELPSWNADQRHELNHGTQTASAGWGPCVVSPPRTRVDSLLRAEDPVPSGVEVRLLSPAQVVELGNDPPGGGRAVRSSRSKPMAEADFVQACDDDVVIGETPARQLVTVSVFFAEVDPSKFASPL
jgi:hypothetical protein